MGHEDEKRVALLDILSEIHRKEGPDKLDLEVTFAIDPLIEGLGAALYMDGSDSMRHAGNYGRRGLLAIGRKVNPVEESMRIIVPYIAEKDANKQCRVAYWATGSDGKSIQVIGEMDGPQAAQSEFDGPNEFGGATYLLPAVRDFVAYIRSLMAGGETVKSALAVIVTDGQFHDFEDVMTYTRDLATAIMEGKFPKTTFTVVGVGPEIDKEQMSELMHEATPESYTGREIWCYALADSIGQLPEIVSHLVDENVPAFWGGATVADEHGTVVKQFDDMVPGVISFTLPENARSFTITVDGKPYVQSLVGLPSQNREEDH